MAKLPESLAPGIIYRRGKRSTPSPETRPPRHTAPPAHATPRLRMPTSLGMSPTVGTFSTLYLRDVERLVIANERTGNTFRQYQSLARYFAPLAERPLAELTVAELREWHHQIAEEARDRDRPAVTNGTATANRALNLLGLVFRRAEEDGMIPRGSAPTRAVRRFRQAPRERYLTEAEMGALWGAIGKVERKVVRHAKRPKALAYSHYQCLRLIILLALRRNEALSLRWEQVDLAGQVLTFPRSKTGYREVSCSQAACDLLRQQLRRRVGDCPWVFPSRAAGMHVKYIYEAWQVVLAASGINPQGVVIHTIRHGLATCALRRGTPIEDVSLLLGHANPRITREVYARPLATPGTRELVQRHAQIVGAQ